MGLGKGHTNNKEGRPKGALSSKRKEWEQLGDSILNDWTDFVKLEGDKMIKDGNFEDFYPLYKDLLNYFRPRLQSATLEAKVEAKGEIEIVLKEPEWDK